MKILNITDIEYNALREENAALKEKVLSYQKRKEKKKEKPMPISVNTKFKSYPSVRAAEKDIKGILNSIDRMIENMSLQLAEAKSQASYFEARYADELKAPERSVIFSTVKKNKETYNGIVLRCTADLNMLAKSKETFINILNEITKENENNEKKP